MKESIHVSGTSVTCTIARIVLPSSSGPVIREAALTVSRHSADSPRMPRCEVTPVPEEPSASTAQVALYIKPGESAFTYSNLGTSTSIR
jgi:hypothetical protein